MSELIKQPEDSQKYYALDLPVPAAELCLTVRRQVAVWDQSARFCGRSHRIISDLRLIKNQPAYLFFNPDCKLKILIILCCLTCEITIIINPGDPGRI